MLNKVSLFALSLGLFGFLLVRSSLSVPSFRSVSVAPLLFTGINDVPIQMNKKYPCLKFNRDLD